MAAVKITVGEAKARLDDLVEMLEAPDEVVLSRDGHPAVRLSPIRQPSDPASRRRIMKAAQARIAGQARGKVGGASAAISQDFLYDGCGLPA